MTPAGLADLDQRQKGCLKMMDAGQALSGIDIHGRTGFYARRWAEEQAPLVAHNDRHTDYHEDRHTDQGTGGSHADIHHDTHQDYHYDSHD